MKTAIFVSLLACSPLFAAPSLKLVTKGLKEPIWATSTKSAPKYLYILEKPGVIKIFNQSSKTLLPTPFLDITSKIKIKMNEQGLLGMAFSPDFSKTGRFYLNYTNLKGDTHISRFTCDPKNPLQANTASEQVLLKIDQDSRNHNGGWLGFGPDNLLYIATGDGGSAFDPKNRAQDLSQLLGKILRIHVGGPAGYSIPSTNPFLNVSGARPEIYAYGLRNPWRCSWDRKTKDFYIADVGQKLKEEINFVPAGKGKGANYGWRKREGLIATPKVGADSVNQQYDPIYTYDHGAGSNQGISITGGFVYRGSVSALRGKYFFADWANPRLWSIEVKGGKATNFQDWTAPLNLHKNQIYKISSFAEDANGEMYLMDFLQGTLYKFSN